MNAVHFFFSLSRCCLCRQISFLRHQQPERELHTHTHTWLFIINHRMYCVAVGWRSLVIYLCIIFLSFIRVPDQIEILNWMMIVWAHFPSLRNVILIVLKEENWEKDNHFLLSFNHFFCFVSLVVIFIAKMIESGSPPLAPLIITHPTIYEEIIIRMSTVKCFYFALSLCSQCTTDAYR